MTRDDPLLATREGGVLHLMLDRPAKRNALSEALRRRITEELTAAAADETVGAVLLSGAGGHFCAGFDLDEIAAAPDPLAVFGAANAYHHRVHTFPKPLVAAIEGTAVAGGLDLALMCDLRIAARDARLGQPQVRQGIPAVFELLAGVVGDASARDLCLTGRTVDGDEALRIGLVHRVVDTTDVEAGSILATALGVAADLASLPAAAATKAQIVAGQAEIFPAS